MSPHQSTHGLEVGDNIFMTVKPTNTRTVSVQYDNKTRRIVFDPKSITTTNIIKNTLTVTGHEFVEGDRVLYRGTTIGGLTDGTLYYIYPYDSNSVQLIREKYQLSQSRPKIEDITSVGTGTLLKVNPPLYVKRNEKLKFDLSDSSLSFVVSGVRSSSF